MSLEKETTSLLSSAIQELTMAGYALNHVKAKLDALLGENKDKSVKPILLTIQGVSSRIQAIAEKIDEALDSSPDSPQKKAPPQQKEKGVSPRIQNLAEKIGEVIDSSTSPSALSQKKTEPQGIEVFISTEKENPQ